MTATASHEALDLVFFGIAASVQAAEEGNTSFLVRSAGATVLVDASGSPHQNLLRAGSSCTDVDAVVLTHAHTDHIYALPSILHQAWLLKRTKPLTLLGLPATLGVARELGEALDLWRRDWSFELRWQEVDHDSVWRSGDLSLEFFRVDHDGHPTIGIGIAAGTKRVVYSCDTGPSDEVFRRALGADWLIHEAGNGSEARNTSRQLRVHAAAPPQHQRTLFGQGGSGDRRAGRSRTALPLSRRLHSAFARRVGEGGK